MKVKAIISFCGLVSMAVGQEKDLPQGEVLADLLHAGYVVPLEPETEEAKPAEAEESKVEAESAEAEETKAEAKPAEAEESKVEAESAEAEETKAEAEQTEAKESKAEKTKGKKADKGSDGK